MSTTDRVREHYAGAGLADRVLAAAGGDGAPLTVDALAPHDELHAGGLATSLALLDRLDLAPGTRLLDVGCGLGGTSRVAADRYGCAVTGVDLSPDFVAAARTLTERVGLAHLLTFAVGDGGPLPCPDASHDRAAMIHVGMNVPDKAGLFADVRRVLRPGGLFAVHDQMRAGPGALRWPQPWAADEETSFVEPPSAYVDALTVAGFEVLTVEDRRAEVAAAAGQRPEDRAVVFGPAFAERAANVLAATRAGVLAPVLVVARC